MPPPPRPHSRPPTEATYRSTVPIPTYASVTRSNTVHGSSSSSVDPTSSGNPTQPNGPHTTIEDVERSDALDDLAPTATTAPRDNPYPWRRVGRDGIIEGLSPIDPEIDLGYEQEPFLPRAPTSNTLAPFLSLDQMLGETTEGLPATNPLDTSSIPAPAPRSPTTMATRTIVPTRSFRNLRTIPSVNSLAEEQANTPDAFRRSYAQWARPITTRASQDERLWRRYEGDQSSRNNPLRRRANEVLTDDEEIDDESGSEDDDIAMLDIGSGDDSDEETMMMEQDAQALLRAARRRRRLAAENGNRPGRRGREDRDAVTLAQEAALRTLYTLGRNQSREDLSIVGGSGGMLQRGQNNRRRVMSTRRRTIEEVVLPDETARPSGMRPTNAGGSAQPTLVRTDKATEDGAKPDRRGESRSKRRKLDRTDTIDQASFPTPPPPTYRSYNPHNASLLFPSRFIDSKAFRVFVKPYSTPSHPHRHCVTFNFKVPELDADSYAQSVRTERAVPVQCGVYYYEVEVLDAGESGYMSVGWMRKGLKMNRLVGWDQGSWGWHGDDGMAFGGHGRGEPFGPSWTKGDVVGCGLDFTTKRAFFTKNGEMIGHVFNNLWAGLCPAVGLRTMGESLAVDFHGPFKFDIDSYVRNLRDDSWRKALEPPTILRCLIVPPPSSTLDAEANVDLFPLSRLHDSASRTSAAWVLDYLRQEGHVSTHTILRDKMVERKWLDAPPNITAATRSQTSHSDGDKVSREEFATNEECCVWLEKRLLASDTKSFPYDMLCAILNTDQLPVVKIHQYLSLLRQADNVRTSDNNNDNSDKTLSTTSTSTATALNLGAVDADMIPLSWGQQCIKESSHWPEEDRELMSRATGLMGLSPDIWPEDGVGGKFQREKDTKRIMTMVRDKLGVKHESYLSKDIRSTMARLSILSTVDPKAGFIDMARFLSDPEAFYMLCRRLPDKDSFGYTANQCEGVSTLFRAS